MLPRPETKQPSIFPSSFTIVALRRKDVGMQRGGRYLSIKVAFAELRCT